MITDIPGWNSDINAWAEWIAPRIPQGGTYLEVGVFLGASLAKMGELRPDIHLIAVDPWIETPGPGWAGLGCFTKDVAPHGSLFLAFLHNMRTFATNTLARTQVIRGSASTVRLLEPVDMLFVDGAHDFRHVIDDLTAFAPLVKKGGIISGHDYSLDFPGVVEAVDTYFERKPDVDGVCWWVDA